MGLEQAAKSVPHTIYVGNFLFISYMLNPDNSSGNDHSASEKIYSATVKLADGRMIDIVAQYDGSPRQIFVKSRASLRIQPSKPTAEDIGLTIQEITGNAQKFQGTEYERISQELVKILSQYLTPSQNKNLELPNLILKRQTGGFPYFFIGQNPKGLENYFHNGGLPPEGIGVIARFGYENLMYFHVSGFYNGKRMIMNGGNLNLLANHSNPRSPNAREVQLALEKMSKLEQTLLDGPESNDKTQGIRVMNQTRNALSIYAQPQQ